MSTNKMYTIRFFHGVKNFTNEPLYSFKDISYSEYENLKNCLSYQFFLTEIEKAYELIVFNYRDYESNNFSIILDYIVKTPKSYSLRGIVNTIDRHILNILTSTYLYLSLLKVKRINEKINDFSFQNSKDIQEIYELKSFFQKETNKYHSTKYQYTFMSALRNKLNHGGNLTKSTTLGSVWSSYWAKHDQKSDLIIQKKDKIFSLLDIKVLKEEAKNIIDNQKHFDAIEKSIPNIFYLRDSIRVYVDLLSFAHSKLREKRHDSLKNSTELIEQYLSSDDKYIYAHLVEYINDHEKEKVNLFPYYQKAANTAESVSAPLHLEDLRMPGEYEDRPTIYKSQDFD